MLNTVGADPEFVLYDDRPRNAITSLGRPKEAPVLLSTGTMYYDNALVEFTVTEAWSAAELVTNLSSVFRDASRMLRPLQLRAQASVMFAEDEMQHPDSFLFGCNPEWEAWKMIGDRPTMSTPPSVKDGFRTCGGHIHVGMDINRSELPAFVRLMDMYVGIPSLLLNNDPTSPARRRLYGGPGKFRPTEYGLEYRTLSNFWLANPRLVNVIHYLTSIASMSNDPVSADVFIALDTNDRERARSLYDAIIAPRIVPGIRAEIEELSMMPVGNMYENWNIA